MDTQTLTELTSSGEKSFFELFMTADLLMKFVMAGLVSASVWSWTIMIEKFGKLREVKSLSKKFEEGFWSGGSLDKLYDSMGNIPRDPLSAMFITAMKEWRRSNLLQSKTDRGLRGASLKQRIEKAMQITMDKELDKLETRIGFLASTGSVAPFVGLFGTVWGIMNSFQSIGLAQNNSLSVIGPGIAEALFTTALGLIAAIPAVLAYNKISADIERYAKTLDNFLGEFTTILSREIDDSAVRAEIIGE